MPADSLDAIISMPENKIIKRDFGRVQCSQKIGQVNKV